MACLQSHVKGAVFVARLGLGGDPNALGRGLAAQAAQLPFGVVVVDLWHAHRGNFDRAVAAVKALLIDVDPAARWANNLISSRIEEPGAAPELVPPVSTL